MVRSDKHKCNSAKVERGNGAISDTAADTLRAYAAGRKHDGDSRSTLASPQADSTRRSANEG